MRKKIISTLMTLAMCVTLSLFAMTIEVKADESVELPLSYGTLTVGLQNGSTDTWAETPEGSGIYTLNSNNSLLATFNSASKTLTLQGNTIGSAASSYDSGREILAGIIWESSELLVIDTNSMTTRIDYGIYSQGPLKISSGGTLNIATQSGGGVLGTTPADSYAIYAKDNVEITGGATVVAGKVDDSGSTNFLSQGIYSGGTVSVNDGTLTANAAGDDSTAIEASAVSVTGGSLTVNAGMTGRTNFYDGITGIKADTVTVAGGTLTVNAAEDSAIGIAKGNEIANVFVQGDNSGNIGTLNINTIGDYSQGAYLSNFTVGVGGELNVSASALYSQGAYLSNFTVGDGGELMVSASGAVSYGTRYANLTVNDGGEVTATATGDISTAIEALTVTVNKGGSIDVTATLPELSKGTIKGIGASAIILNGGEITANATGLVGSLPRTIAIEANAITLNAGTLTATADTNSTAINFYDNSDGFNTTANIPCVSTRFDNTVTNYNLYFNTASGFADETDTSLETTVDGKKYVELMVPVMAADGKTAFFDQYGNSIDPTVNGSGIIVTTPTDETGFTTAFPSPHYNPATERLSYIGSISDTADNIYSLMINGGTGNIKTLYYQGTDPNYTLRNVYANPDSYRIIDADNTEVLTGFTFTQHASGWVEVKKDTGNLFTDNRLDNNFAIVAQISSSVPLPNTPSEEAVDDIRDAKDGDTVELELSGSNTTVDKEVFEELAGKDITLDIVVGDVVWTVHGEDIPEGMDFSDIDFGVSVGGDSISASVINEVTGAVSSVQISIEHDGEFGFSLKLTVDLGGENEGYYANLYYFNEETEQLEFRQSVKIPESGETIFDFNRASDYVFVISEEDKTPKNFVDALDTDWFYEAVRFVNSRSIMAGVSDTEFDPNGSTTRAMMWTVLARMDGVNTEVPEGEMWYSVAQTWAIENEISDGTDPAGLITREQFVTMLYRYEQSKGGGFVGAYAFPLDFPDAEKVSEWAWEATLFMTMVEVITGMDDGNLNPQGNATRAEIATMLMRYLTV